MSIELYLQHSSLDNSCHRTERVQHKIAPMRHHDLGLSYTSTGYGGKIPTQYKVKYNSRWFRVYCAIYSNIGTLYILSNGNKIKVTEYSI